jgi:putative ATPase
MANKQVFLNPMPLAARMRPLSLEEFVGHDVIVSVGSPLERLIRADGSASALSVIIWGPPGVGKTTLAQLIASEKGAGFVQLSAVSSGVKEVRDVIESAQQSQMLYSRQTVLFLDEIHRFSKNQQDALLGAVESGHLVLVAATTENPAVSVVPALLSRSLQVFLDRLDVVELFKVLKSSLSDARGFNGDCTAPDGLLESIATLANGDARRALTLLEAAAATAYEREPDAERVQILEADLYSNSNRVAAVHDRSGNSHYDTISAFIKSVRGSDVDASLFYLAALIDGGEDARFIARRLMILASEDIGLADSQALVIAVSAATVAERVGMPEARIALSHATIYLALAPKSNSAYLAIDKALEYVRDFGTHKIPLGLRGLGVPGGQEAKSYEYPHDLEGALVAQQYLPDEVTGQNFYVAKRLGEEESLASLWQKIRSIIRSKKA